MLYADQGYIGSHAASTALLTCVCPADCPALGDECACPSQCSDSECTFCRSHGSAPIRLESAELSISDVGAHTVVADVHGIDPGHAYVFRVALLVLSGAPRIGGSRAASSNNSDVVKHRLRRCVFFVRPVHFALHSNPHPLFIPRAPPPPHAAPEPNPTAVVKAFCAPRRVARRRTR